MAKKIKPGTFLEIITNEGQTLFVKIIDSFFSHKAVLADGTEMILSDEEVRGKKEEDTSNLEV